HFAADVIAGHKTGFFFDQRDNRARIGQLIDGHGGLERVLNVFAYTGGFSLYAARGGASAITSTDLSAPALAAAEVNFGLNRHIPAVAAAVHRTVVGDAFAVLTELGAQEIGFDAVLVDPPAFAQRRTEVSAALKAYYRLTELALAVLRPGGLLMISSCSSRVEAAAFYQTVTSAANNSGRLLSEHGRTGHPLDHPVGFPEGAYLKAFFAWAR
ncbi:MAG: class I SAM-dependent methyltransferase, partial [Candidatus Promineifilaceae bacterium]|nr:class I SAM-dependent methyltransferase [Candidatus Promineifilaceae bacterium]